MNVSDDFLGNAIRSVRCLTLKNTHTNIQTCKHASMQACTQLQVPQVIEYTPHPPVQCRHPESTSPIDRNFFYNYVYNTYHFKKYANNDCKTIPPITCNKKKKGIF